jgi:hypothetical protein
LNAEDLMEVEKKKELKKDDFDQYKQKNGVSIVRSSFIKINRVCIIK